MAKTTAERLRERWTALPLPVRVALILALLLLFVPWVSVQALPVPWMFIFAAWAAAMVVITFRKPKGERSALWFNVGVVFLALAGVELYLALGRPSRLRFEPEGRSVGYKQDHPDLGFVPVPGRSTRVRRFCDDELIYDVTYGIDPLGRRVGRPARDESAPRLLFLGCSFTYGEGLEDHETYPNLVGELSGDRYQPINLAFSGYGPHQALAMLESGRAAKAVDAPPTDVFFLALAHHAVRVVGRASFDRDGPCYRLQDDGTVIRDGQFRTRPTSAVARRLGEWVHASNIHRRLRRSWFDDAALELMVAIVAAVREQVESTWPDCRFHLLLWGDREERKAARLLAAFEHRGFVVHVVGDVLPDYSDDPDRYALHRYDRHPNARATRTMARWILDELLDGADEERAAPRGAD